jgi:hypothetical protein
LPRLRHGINSFQINKFTIATYGVATKKLTAKQREERRLEAGQLLRTTDLSQAAIARIIGVSRTRTTGTIPTYALSTISANRARRPLLDNAN